MCSDFACHTYFFQTLNFEQQKNWTVYSTEDIVLIVRFNINNKCSLLYAK